MRLNTKRLTEYLLIIVVLLNVGASNAGALELPSISPQQIVSNALAHSYQLRSSDQDIKAAEAKRSQARAQGLPLLSADAKGSRYTGLHESSFGPFFTIPAIESRYNAGVNIIQPAYTGGRITSLKEGSDFQKQAVQALRLGTQADLTLQALTVYWGWSKGYYSVESYRDAVARMEAHAKDMRNLHEAGLATDNDSLATEVLLDQTRLRLEESLRQVELAGAQMAYLTGQELPVDSKPEKPEAPLIVPPPSEKELLQAALRNRAERVARQMEAKAAESQVKVSRADFYPQVALTARYEQARPNIMNIPPQDKWQDDAFAGVAVSWNLFDWGLTKAKVAESSARSAQAKLRINQVEDLIFFEVREASINLRNTRERLTVAERVEKSASRNLEAANDLWQNGLARHSDVLDAHAQLTNAQSGVIAAKGDLALAQAALYHAVGTLVKR